MRRTITTLMFLAVGGLACAVHAADTRDSRNWQYYAAGQSSYRISDDDEGQAAPAGQPSTVANAVAQQQAGQERNALYVADGAGVGDLAQTSFLGGGDCGCQNQNSCGCQNNCISSCMGDCNCTCDMLRIEWLGWVNRGRNTPPLVTTSPGGTAQADAGVLGLATTTTLYGNDPIGTNLRNGGRITYSHLFNDGITTGTFRFWGLENGAETFSTTSANNPIIARPYFNTTVGLPASVLVSFPGLTTGSINVLSKNSLIGIDAWGSRNWYNDGASSIDVLGGYQFTRMDDSVVINSALTATGGNFPGQMINTLDSFRTRNEFNGGSLGFIGRSYRGPITLEALGKVALGNMRETVIVSGSTSTLTPGSGTLTHPRGFLAAPSNIGSAHHDVIAYVPEINVNLLYNISPSWRAMVGYSFIYWNNVVLAGNQIDTNLQNPPAATPPPSPKFQRTDFWVQGISLGGDYRW